MKSSESTIKWRTATDRAVAVLLPLLVAAEAGQKKDPDQASASITVSKATKTTSASVAAAEAVSTDTKDQ